MGLLVSGTYYITVTDKYGCIKEVSFVTNCCELVISAADYDCDTKLVRLIYTGSGGTFLQASIDGGAYIPIPANNLINFGALTNGAHTIDATSSVPGCNGRITFTVNCCPDMDLQSVTSVDCLTLTLAYTGTPNEFRIDNGAWSPLVGNTIILLTALTPGNHTVGIRNSSNTNCMDELVFNCTACPTYNIGTPDILRDCTIGQLTLDGIIVPANLEGCTRAYYKIFRDGVLSVEGNFLWTDWATTMSFPVLLTDETTYRIEIRACKKDGCLIYTGEQLMSNLFEVTYDCTNKLYANAGFGSAILTYTGLILLQEPQHLQMELLCQMEHIYLLILLAYVVKHSRL